MKPFKYVLFLLLIAIIGVSVYIAVQPNSFMVMVNRNINAPADVIFETIADSTTTDRSAFWKESEKLEKSASNPSTSIHQVYSSKNIGTSELSWNLKPNGDGTTQVSKSISADKLSFLYKAKSIFSSKSRQDLMDEMAEDLKQLDIEVVKSMMKYDIKINGKTEYGGGFYMYKTTSASSGNITNMMARQFTDIMNFMHEHNIKESGMPFTIYNEMGDNGDVIMSNAIPVRDRVIVADDSNVLCGYIEKTRAVKATLVGDYKNLDEAWRNLKKYIRENNLEPSEQHPFEIYLNDPGSIPNPANYLTEIYIPIKDEVVVTETE